MNGMRRVEITFVGDWPEAVREDGLKGTDFEVYDTGRPHPDPEWASFTEMVVYRNGKPVQYIYEGDLETLSGYNQQQVVAQRDQLLEHFAFDPEKNLFRN